MISNIDDALVDPHGTVRSELTGESVDVEKAKVSKALNNLYDSIAKLDPSDKIDSKIIQRVTNQHILTQAEDKDRQQTFYEDGLDQSFMSA